MGCAASSQQGVFLKMEDIQMRKVDRHLPDHEKAAVLRIYKALDVDNSNDMSEDEMRELFRRFGFETNPFCVQHVSETLKSWEAEERLKTNKNAANKNLNNNSKTTATITWETFERWWPSILDYFERISYTDIKALDSQGEEGFDLLLQPFQEAGCGPASCSDTPLAVDKITRLCHSMRVQFKDSTFAPSDAAVGGKQQVTQIAWRRISEFVGAKALMFSDGTNAGDTIGISFGRNKYSADITSLADRFDLLMGVVYPPRFNPAGIYCVKIVHNSAVYHVIVDDYIPVDSATSVPVFLHSSDPKEIWTLIIDKAFAKLKGSYEKLHLSTNLMLDPLSLLTGSRPSTLSAPKSMRLHERCALYWACIKLYMDSHWFLCSSPSVAHVSSGLILDHYYSIIGYVEDDATGIRLIQARNPMGTAEWKGAWSDDAKEWSTYPKIAKRCLAAEEDDGAFWMSIEDFAANFGPIRCNALLPQETIPVEEFDVFGKSMAWGSTEMAWREAQLHVEAQRKIREEMRHVTRLVSSPASILGFTAVTAMNSANAAPTTLSSVSNNASNGNAAVASVNSNLPPPPPAPPLTSSPQPPLAVMTPFNCPQYRLVVPTGASVTFYYRGCRVLDADGDGMDDDEELVEKSEFDAWRHLSGDALQMELPYSWIVRGDGRQAALPTKHIISANFSNYTACTLTAGTYVLMMMAFDRPDVSLKLVLRTAGPQQTALMKISEIPPIKDFAVLQGGAQQGRGVVGLGKHLPTGNLQLDLKRPPFKQIGPYISVAPRSAAVKNISLVLVLGGASPNDSSNKNTAATACSSINTQPLRLTQRSGSLTLITLRKPLDAPFSWDAASARSEEHAASRSMRTLYYIGSGQSFVALPFFTGEGDTSADATDGVPFTLMAWSPQGAVDLSLIQ